MMRFPLPMRPKMCPSCRSGLLEASFLSPRADAFADILEFPSMLDGYDIAHDG